MLSLFLQICHTFSKLLYIKVILTYGIETPKPLPVKVSGQLAT